MSLLTQKECFKTFFSFFFFYCFSKKFILNFAQTSEDGFCQLSSDALDLGKTKSSDDIVSRLSMGLKNTFNFSLKGHDELCRAYIKRITNYEDQKRCLTCPFCSRKMTFTKSFEMGHYLR